MSNDQLTDEVMDDETLTELIEFRQTTLNHHTEKGNKTQAILHNMVLVALLELQERRKADSAEPIYQYRIRNGYNGQVTEWQTIRRDQVDFVLKAQPLNAEFRIISAPQPAPVVNDELYKLANHVASSKNGLPEEWQDWAEELESEIRRTAMLQGKVDDEVGSWNNHKNTPTAKSVSENDKVPTVSFYRDGIEAAANWVDHQREIYDIKHGRQDPDTGAFEFGSDIERDYSDTFVVIAEGIRALHPNAGIPPAPVMPDSENGLMPCPFCGGKARQLTIEQDNDPHFGGDVITCTECGASSHVEFGFKENLKSAWNSRAAMLKGNVQ
ncbi:Lar family restriction alleviation protein [Citrobacter cronae]|uniref:Lar family restriction alleviation protein n=1 Tax=Citrobacter cronae TaxID=1748967 RepID=UPI0018688EC2|nr:Lar family restriction alleviation protein [Citrobacter cronae]